MNLHRASLLVLALLLALAPAQAEQSRANRSRGDRSAGVKRLELRGQMTPIAKSESVVSRGGTVTVYVAPPPTGSNVTGDGTLGLPYATIQFALLAAVSGDEIRVMPGTYNECIDTTAFALGAQKNLAIIADDWVNSQNRTSTTIDGTGQCVFPFSVVNLAGSGVSPLTRLEGFTITGASASGVFLLGSATVTNNIISGNVSVDGAGLYIDPGTCFYGTTNSLVTNNLITNNTADDFGSCQTGGAACVDDLGCGTAGPCLFAGGDGGGIFIRAGAVNSGGPSGCLGGNSAVVVDGNVIDGNGADNAFGGGIYVLTNTQSGRTAAVSITQNLISNNSTLPFSVGYGGGIWMGTYGYGIEQIDFVGNTVTSNSSTGDGGGLSAWIDSLGDADHIINIFSNEVQLNSAEGGGGGMDLFAFARDIGPGDSIQLNAQTNIVLNNDASGVGFGLYPGIGGGVLANIWSQKGLSAVLELNVTANDIRGNTASLAGAGLAIIATSDADPDLDGMSGQAVVTANIENNLIATNTAADTIGGAASGGGIFSYQQAFGESVSLVNFRFNTIAGNIADVGSGGFEIESYTLFDTNLAMEGLTDLSVNHNIIYDNTGFGLGGPLPGAAGILAANDGTANFSLDVNYNSLFMNPGGGYEGWIISGGNDLLTDPALDASFQPLQCSPTIDAGEPSLLPGQEQAPNGGRVNLGHTGRTSLATQTLADSNGDGVVDGLDIVRLSVAFGTFNVDARFDAAVDLDGSSFVDGVDLALMVADFTASCP